MIGVVNNNSIKDYSNIQNQYNIVIIFFTSMNDSRVMKLYFNFYEYAKQYISNKDVLFLIVNMDDQRGREFAFSKNIYGVPTLLIYKNKQLNKLINGIPTDFEQLINLKSEIKQTIKGIN